jgi:hypothetical protein
MRLGGDLAQQFLGVAHRHQEADQFAVAALRDIDPGHRADAVTLGPPLMPELIGPVKISWS